MSKRFTTLVIMALFLTATAAIAQVTPTAKITGKVTDAQGAPLPGVSVEATSPKMVGKATSVTDADGGYRLFSLPSGIYEVTYTLQGFKTLKREGIVVQLSQTLNLNASLEQTTLEESVTVVGQSPLIDVKSTVKGQTMTKETFMTLPRSRNFTGLISTVPGVQYESNTGGLSVDGATGTENMWYMDGADITQGHTGVQGQSAVMELVEEVKVTASGYNAEFGGSMGGVVNVITRSGGNTFHGDIIGYFNNNSLLMQGKARDYIRWNPYDDEVSEYVNADDLYYHGGYDRDPYSRYEAVFNLGGYIVKDKLWFFGSINPQYAQQKASRFFLSDGTDSTSIDGTEPYFDYYTKYNYYNGQIKLTAAPAKGLRLSVSAVNNYYKWRGSIPSIDGTSTKDADWKAYGYDYPNWSGAFMADYSISNNLLLSARAGYSFQNTNHQQVGNYFTTYYNNYSSYVYEGVIPDDYLYYAGAINYSGSRLVLQRQKQHKYSANFDVTYYMTLGGEHAWKAGFQWIKNHEDYSNSTYYPMVNLYWGKTCTALSAYGVDDFTGTYGWYYIRGSWTSPYGYDWNIKRNSYAAYLQDSWTINGRLTINAGIRAESEYIPSFNTDYPAKPVNFGWGDKIAPRLGLVYDVFGDSSLKVFGSFGIYYDVLKLYMAEGTYGGLKWISDYYTLDNYDFWDIANEYLAGDTSAEAIADQAAGGTYMGSINFRVPSFDTTDPNIKPVAQREISLGAEKKLTEDLSLSIRLVQKHLIRTIEDIGITGEEGEVYYISNPGSQWIQDKFTAAGEYYGLDYWAQPKAKREYYGMNLTLEKRFSHNWQGGINYTLSRTTGNYSGLSSSDESGRNSPNVERFFDFWYMAYEWDGSLLDGPLPQDRTHYIKAYGSYTTPFGLTVGVVAYARSGLPKSTQLSINNTYMYPNGYGDLGRMPWCAWADLYIEYTMKIASKYQLSLNLQINNVTNTKTWVAYEDTPNRTSMSVSDEEILSKTFDWEGALADYWPNIQFNKYTSRFDTWTARLGARFSF